MNELRYRYEGLGGGQGVFPAKIFFGIPAKPFSLVAKQIALYRAVLAEYSDGKSVPTGRSSRRRARAASVIRWGRELGLVVDHEFEPSRWATHFENVRRAAACDMISLLQK
jgi:hypothetical protein